MPFPAQHAEQGSHQGENDVLAVYVGSRLAVVEAQDLESSQFAHALRDIYIRQVKEHEESECSRRTDDDPDHNVQTLHALVEVIAGLVNTAVGDDSLDL